VAARILLLRGVPLIHTGMGSTGVAEFSVLASVTLTDKHSRAQLRLTAESSLARLSAFRRDLSIFEDHAALDF